MALLLLPLCLLPQIIFFLIQSKIIYRHIFNLAWLIGSVLFPVAKGNHANYDEAIWWGEWEESCRGGGKRYAETPSCMNNVDVSMHLWTIVPLRRERDPRQTIWIGCTGAVLCSLLCMLWIKRGLSRSRSWRGHSKRRGMFPFIKVYANNHFPFPHKTGGFNCVCVYVCKRHDKMKHCFS